MRRTHTATRPLRVLFASAEIFPLAKSGGLGDVCAALPQALSRQGARVQLLMPGYDSALDQVRAPKFVRDISRELRAESAQLVRGTMPDSDLPVWLVDCPALFRRESGLYQDAEGRDWCDNGRRFGAFCQAITGLAGAWANAAPDVVHCHDWHTGPAALMVSRLTRPRPVTVFTIHNIAYQGLFPRAVLHEASLPADCFNTEGGEFYGQVSFLKAGLAYADHLTTVSPTYAREILTPEYGHGMEGILARRADRLTGILNGIDCAVWNPERDPHLPASYGADDLAGKAYCKRALQREFGLAEDAAVPLLIVVNRLTHQKMADVLIDVLPRLMQSGESMQVAVLGRGDRDIERRLRQLAGQFAGRVAVRIGYEEPPAHRLHAGGDMLIHGSRFEPCGLAQLYAMRYGTPPVVRRVGGLADTVVHASDDAIADGTASGVMFDKATLEDMERGIREGLRLFGDHDRWRRVLSGAMRRDFGWERSAQRYMNVYNNLLANRVADQFLPAAA